MLIGLVLLCLPKTIQMRDFQDIFVRIQNRNVSGSATLQGYLLPLMVCKILLSIQYFVYQVWNANIVTENSMINNENGFS